MKAFSRIIVAIVFVTISLISRGNAQSPTEIFEKFRPAVCLVEYYKNVSSRSKIGSYVKVKEYRIGVLVDAGGLVMVNSDVYPLSLDIITGNGMGFFSGEPSDFKVKLHDGRELEAEFVGKDDLSQVAFLQISEKLTEPLPFVEFSSTDSVKVGQPVYLLELLGEPYHFQPLFTPVFINAVLTTPRKKFLVKNETNALSAGGLVISAAGKALGVTLRSEVEFDFDVSPDMTEGNTLFLEIAPSEWFRKLIANPPVLTPTAHQGKSWLGISMQALTEELKEYWKVPARGGVVVDRVFPDSPAEKAGLKVGDVIFRFNDEELEIDRDDDLEQFRNLITQQPPGTTIELTLFRDGKVKSKKVTLAAAPRAIDLAEKFQARELGLEVREITSDILFDYDYAPDIKGVYVFQVDRAAPAGIGGLRPGSIITHLNGEPIEDLRDFQQTLTRILQAHPKKLMFRIQEPRATDFVFVDVK
ncbi:MAG: PDZ domain-containing protein [Calditrichaeota bacterium]|nr:MAG: PDZ domain-containing protein [Calditrichota bacterium]